MCSPSSRRRQRGLASLELALLIPILVVIVYLAVTITKLGHVRLDVQAAARTSAYAAAYGVNRLGNVAAASRPYVASVRITSRTAGATAGSDFLDVARARHARFQALHGASVAPTARAAEAVYVAPRVFGAWRQTLREQHATVAAPIWEREQIPLGYDRYLRNRLRAARIDVGILFNGNASDAMPNVFPKAK